MKGTIFNILEEFVCEKFGDEAYEDLLERAESQLSDKGPYVGPGTYPDRDFFLLVSEFLNQQSIPFEEGLRAFGQYSFFKLMQKIPVDLAYFKTPQEILLNLNDVIHTEVKKLFFDAEPPYFKFSEVREDSFTMRYYSKRKLHHFVMGLLDSLGAHFAKPLSFDFVLEQTEEEEVGVFKLKFG